jgi:hypothetical protein
LRCEESVDHQFYWQLDGDGGKDGGRHIRGLGLGRTRFCGGGKARKWMGEKWLDVVFAGRHGGLAGFYSSPEAIR